MHPCSVMAKLCYGCIITEAGTMGKVLIDGAGIAVRGPIEEEVLTGGEHLGRAEGYFGAAVEALTWPAISLRSFG
jgi:hypothetical protein